eukprot:6091414-Prorocentrum_lima.AAC.1
MEPPPKRAKQVSFDMEPPDAWLSWLEEARAILPEPPVLGPPLLREAPCYGEARDRQELREDVIQINQDVISFYRSLSQGFKMAVNTPLEQIPGVKSRLRELVDKYVRAHAAAQVRTEAFHSLVDRGLILG